MLADDRSAPPGGAGRGAQHGAGDRAARDHDVAAPPGGRRSLRSRVSGGHADHRAGGVARGAVPAGATTTTQRRGGRRPRAGPGRGAGAGRDPHLAAPPRIRWGPAAAELGRFRHRQAECRPGVRTGHDHRAPTEERPAGLRGEPSGARRAAGRSRPTRRHRDLRPHRDIDRDRARAGDHHLAGRGWNPGWPEPRTPSARRGS